MSTEGGHGARRPLIEAIGTSPPGQEAGLMSFPAFRRAGQPRPANHGGFTPISRRGAGAATRGRPGRGRSPSGSCGQTQETLASALRIVGYDKRPPSSSPLTPWPADQSPAASISQGSQGWTPGKLYPMVGGEHSPVHFELGAARPVMVFTATLRTRILNGGTRRDDAGRERPRPGEHASSCWTTRGPGKVLPDYGRYGRLLRSREMIEE